MLERSQVKCTLTRVSAWIKPGSQPGEALSRAWPECASTRLGQGGGDPEGVKQPLLGLL
jgi:hypothetical protein